ncbi:unnamed protein product, partial [Musa banksii]
LNIISFRNECAITIAKFPFLNPKINDKPQTKRRRKERNELLDSNTAAASAGDVAGDVVVDLADGSGLGGAEGPEHLVGDAHSHGDARASEAGEHGTVGVGELHPGDSVGLEEPRHDHERRERVGGRGGCPPVDAHPRHHEAGDQ